MSGELVIEDTFEGGIEISIGHLNRGVYACLVTSGVKSYVTKVIIN